MDRKLPNNLDNPIDNIIIDIGRKFYPIFRKLNFTPNILTTISLILILISTYYFKNSLYIISSITYFLSYCFDVMDGNYARTYNMVSKFGDHYDHIKDIICNLLFFYVLYSYNRLPSEISFIVVVIFIILLITMSAHLGCQEQYITNDNNKSEYLNKLQKICPKYIYEHMSLLRYFGNGTFILYISFIILLNKFF